MDIINICHEYKKFDLQPVKAKILFHVRVYMSPRNISEQVRIGRCTLTSTSSHAIYTFPLFLHTGIETISPYANYGSQNLEADRSQAAIFFSTANLTLELLTLHGKVVPFI